jgi:UDP-2-acetamido-2,6-beta-L-arabino-hexul-4-ose reductase
MIRVGITGSNGFIGWHLSQTIKLQIDKFEIIDFKRTWFDNNLELDKFVSKCDIIVHLAGLNRHSDETAIYNTNVGLANKFVDAFKRTSFKGQVIFSSSIQEERNNVFGNSKKEARAIFTKWANDHGTQFKGLIIPNVYGAFGIPFYNSVVATFSHQLVNNESPKIENDATLNLIYINDLVSIIIELFNKSTEKIVNIQYSDTYNVSEILEILNRYKITYFENGQIPNFQNQFEINLFNTFRSYFNLATHFPLKYKNNIDERGNFVEIIRLEVGGQVSF